ncbi:MAG: SusC/RagA family TonB-linked outer membrane protein [Candidatus Cryptobacteroides sp.]
MLKSTKTLGILLCIAAFVGGGFMSGLNAAENANSAQQNNVCSGVVLDASGQSVIGASIQIKGTSTGTVTDIDGNFSLSGVKPGDVLVVSCISYVTQEIVWNGQAMNIVLEEDNMLLEEVVVVGFGTQKKVNATGAVSTVSSKEIASRPVNSVTDALQGVVAGMTLSTPSSGGTLNSNKSINIRGIGTIGSGSSVTPLILIDGMEGTLESLNPQDVESISVLKDASASSIYGSRAAGGVILVTTKSGKEGKTVVNYNNSFRFNSPLNMPEMMDSYSWAVYMNTASINSGNGSWFSEKKLADIKAAQKDPSMQTMFKNTNNRWEVWDSNDILPIGNTDWLKEQFGNSFSHEHTLSVNGGSEKIRYYFSANYLNQDGILRHGDDNKQRYTATGRIDADITKWLNLTYSTRFTRTDYEAPSVMVNGTDEFYHNMCRYWPIIPTKDPNGNWVAESYISRLMNGGMYKTQNDVFSQHLALRATPVKGLNINAELNYRIINQNSHTDWQTTYGYDCDGNPFVDFNANSAVREYNNKSNYFNPNIYADYSHSFGEHNLKVMAGFQSEYWHGRTITAQQYGIIAGLPTLDTTASNPTAAGGYSTWTTAGFFGRINYDYAGRYLVEANLRYDGSSRFLRENRWNLFPSFSAGWNIAKEPFWEDFTKWVNVLKIRGSWGELGNQNTDSLYPFYPAISYKPKGGNWIVNDAKPNISGQPSLVSSALTWERSRTWEVGLDFGAFNNRLTGSFGYYQRKTYDMVGPAPELPDVLGTAEPKTNNLDMTTKGWDLQISWRDVVNDFSYGVSLVLSDSKTIIDKYPNPAKELGKYYNGAVYGDIWGFETVGIASSQAEMDAHLAKADQSYCGSNWTAGDIMYADINGDGVVDEGEYTVDNHGDLKVIGNSTPRYNFGLNFDFAYKGFDLKLFFQGTLKRDYMAGSATFWGATGTGKWQALGFTAHSDYWTPENTDAYYPRPDWGGWRNTWTQTRYLQNAAYCRLKNVTLGYTLPSRLTQKIYVQNLRLFVSAENLLTITKFTDISDPELIGAGYGGNLGKTYPLSKTVSFGVSVTF